MTKTCAVFGLGSMGFGIGESLLRAGHTVYGYDPAVQQVAKLVALGAKQATIDSALPNVDIAVIVVLNASQLESVLIGDSGLTRIMRRDSCVIACPTIAPNFARKMESECLNHGIHYLDAPISGGSARASSGQLSVMASGTDSAFNAAKPALDAMAETVFELGTSAGNGSAMKAVNQLLAGVHIAAMAEAMTFGIGQGIDAAELIRVISQCAGTSWMFENRAPHVVDGDYTPHSSVDIWPKDLGIVLEIAHEAKFSAPMTATALQLFLAASGSGLGEEDDAAVAKVYARNGGIELP